jgi:hypothetical protein
VERPISKTTLYVGGAARFKDLIYVIAKDRGLAEQDVEHTRFIAFDQMKFAHMGDRNWNAVAVCVVKKPSEKMVAVGEDGEVFTYVAGSHDEESIRPQPVVLRNVAVVDGIAVACGMKRQVYRRVAEKSWSTFSAPPPKQGENAGFEAICGFDATEIYAVGWNGEIWEWTGSTWAKHDSPTNLILTGATCAEDGNVYICGQTGTLLRGRHDRWELIELEDFDEDLWDVHWFDGRLYLASMTSLYTYMPAGLLPVDFGEDAPATCYRLSDAEGVLWSVGSDDVFSFDGTAWLRVD